jgi:hypothetical protein
VPDGSTIGARGAPGERAAAIAAPPRGSARPTHAT